MPILNLNPEWWDHPPGGRVSDFVAAAVKFGLAVSNPARDGKIHRVRDNLTAGENDNGWYVLQDLDGDIYGAYGSWVAGRGHETFTGSASPGNIDKLRVLIADHKKMSDLRHSGAAFAASAIVSNAASAASDHPYLISKKILTNGAMQIGEKLIIPARGWDGVIATYQEISPAGGKKYFPGGEIRGKFFTLGKITGTGPVFIAEGFATAASIHQATGLPGICAFSAGNLLPVAEGFRALYNNSLWICADNDWETPGNPGISAATEVIQNITGGRLVAPPEKFLQSGESDFNDLAVRLGESFISSLIKPAQSNRVVLSDWTACSYTGKAPEIDWLAEGSLPCAVPGIMAGVGGIGKSYLALQACLDIATAPDNPYLFGGRLAKNGRAIMLTSEDNRDSIHRRLDKLDPAGDKRHAAGNNMVVVPLPSAGGVKHLVSSARGEFQKTPFYEDIKSQLKELSPRLVIFDPLQAFTNADINSDPAAGQFFYNCLSEICAESGTSAIVMHHMSKDALSGVESLMQARQYIRGSSALVDGSRWAYAMWYPSEEFRGRVCQTAGIDNRENRVVCGGIVKANDEHNAVLRIYIRNDAGLLEDKTECMDTGAISSAVYIPDEIYAAARQYCVLNIHKVSRKGLYDRFKTMFKGTNPNLLLDKLVEDNRIAFNGAQSDKLFHAE